VIRTLLTLFKSTRGRWLAVLYALILLHLVGANHVLMLLEVASDPFGAFVFDGTHLQWAVDTVEPASTQECGRVCGLLCHHKPVIFSDLLLNRVWHQ
jgi:hypothetical protein